MATRPTITVKFRQPGSSTTQTFTANVISGCSWNWGRQRITDTFQGNNCQVYGIKPSTVTTWPEIGASVSVVVTDRTSSLTAGFVGTIADVEIQYGIIASLDTFTMTIESPLSRGGREIATLTTTAAASTYNMAEKINDLTTMNVGPGFVTSSYYACTTTAQTVEQTITDHVNLWTRTEQGRVAEYGDQTDPDITTMGAVLVGSRLPVSDNTFFFGDTNPAHIKYNQLIFQSLADNYSTKVLVNAAGFAQQSDGTGSYVYEIDTINGSATEADNLAGYIKAQLDINQRTPTSIRFDGATTNSVDLCDFSGHGRGGSITFRGTTYSVYLQGGSFSANASNWEGELYVSSAAYLPFLTLDSSVYGIIGTNKLGF